MMKNKITNEKKSITLTPTIFHILVVLSGGERHGYAILREVKEISAGKSSLGPTTLYRSIRTMLDGKLIEELDERPDPASNDERRRYYRLTDLGIKVLSNEVERLESLVKVARQKNVLIGNHRVAVWEKQA
jgi:DNA-binding PadR family transcriptional regulator